MKNILFTVVLIGLLSGCQSLGDHFNCMAEVDRTIPAQTQQKYVRTDTKCIQSSEKTITGPFGANFGTVPSDKGDINCSAVPIYETIVLNQAQRDAAYQQCRNNVNNQRTQQNYVAPQQQSYSPPQQETYSPSTLRPKYSSDTPYCKGIPDKNSSEYKAQCQQPDTFLPTMMDAVNRNKLSKKPIASALSVRWYKGPYDIYLFGNNCTPTNADYPLRAEIKNSSDKTLRASSCYAVKNDGFIYFSGGGFSATLPNSLFIFEQQPTTAPPQAKPVSPITTNSNTSSMEQAKQKCIGLGFAAGTESFGQCVLKLSK